MSDNVVTIRPDVSAESERKAHFLDHLAQAVDKYVSDFGVEPDAVVFVMGGVKQTARSGWTIQGDSRGGATSMLALAHATLIRDIVNPE